jgi:hypothetical protein
MSDPPPGFVLDKPAATGGGLPPGFVLDTPAPEKKAPETGMGEALWAGILHGAGNVIHGAARIGARMGEATDTGFGPELAPGSAEAVDKTTIARQAAFEKEPTSVQHPIATGIGEVGGEMATATALTPPLPLGSGLWGAVLQGALPGAGAGAIGGAAAAPQGEIGPSVARGAAAGGIVGGALGGAVAPEMRAMLRDTRGSGPGIPVGGGRVDPMPSTTPPGGGGSAPAPPSRPLPVIPPNDRALRLPPGAIPETGAGTGGLPPGGGAIPAAPKAPLPVIPPNDQALRLPPGATPHPEAGTAGLPPGGRSSALSQAIASNNSQAVDQAMIRRYRSTIKPQRLIAGSEGQLASQDSRIMTAVDNIIANRQSLQLTDASGNVVRGALPRSLRQFSEAVDQTKTQIFKQYDAMSRAAGDLGVQVNLAPVIQQLRAVAKTPEVVDLHPNLATEAERLAQNFEARGFYTPSAAQDVIQNLNKTLQGFYRNPTHDTVSRASLLAPVATTLRGELDKAIESAQGPGYQALRQQYQAIRSVEKDVASAVQREANKIPGGLAGTFADLAASEEAIRGVLTLNPALLLRAGGVKAAKQAVKYINDPNRAIERLFTRRASSLAPPSALRTGLSYAAEQAPLLAPAAGFEAGRRMPEPPRPY